MQMGRTLVLAATWGLLAGLVEGAMYWAFAHWRFLSWEQSLISAGPEQIWISSLTNGLLFPLLLAPLTLASRALAKERRIGPMVFALSVLTFYDWIHLAGRVHRAGSLILAAGIAFQMTRWLSPRGHLLAKMQRAFPLVLVIPLGLFAGVSGWRWVSEERQVRVLPEAAVNSPNVLLIVLDTARADYFPLKRQPEGRTPHLDALARESVVFERAYSTSSWTPPAHASLFTGRWPFEHGVTGRGDWRPLDGSMPTLAEVLRRRGYRTGAFSSNTLWTGPRTGFDRGFIRYSSLYKNVEDCFARTFYGRLTYRTILPRLGLPSDRPMRLAPEINGEFLSWLGNDRSRPFFVFLNYMDLHDPPYTLRKLHSGDERFAQDSPNGQRVADYGQALILLDRSIGELLGRLKQDKRMENTIVVLTSDHGELLGEYGLSGHGNALYHPLVHVPLMIRPAGGTKGPVSIGQPVSHVDLAATILDFCGLPQDLLPGRSLNGLWQEGKGLTQPRPVFAEIDGAEFERAPDSWPIRRGWQRSLIARDWQVIWSKRGEFQLFSLAADATPEFNLWETPESRLIVQSLLQKAAGDLPRTVLPESPATTRNP